MRGGSIDLKEKVTEGKSIILNKDELERQYAYIYLKRFFDVILSLIGLLVLSLLFLIIAACFFSRLLSEEMPKNLYPYYPNLLIPKVSCR